ncbi:MAG TPA: DUF58 domain-containing protein [bacterium]|nr:DUF58 domain-containing protein [bacterium]
MIPREVLEKVRKIEITTRSIVQDTFAGQYESIFKGRGMEFDEVREYQPGDDIRTIDWNVTARTGWLHVKKYIEERELTVLIVFDASGSFDFGTSARLKRELAAEIGAVLAFAAIRNNDKVGLLVFTDQIEAFVPPRKGSKHVLRIIREILHFESRSRGTAIAGALEYAMRVMRRHSVMFLISDFRDSGYADALRVANKKHDVVAITISDPKEMEVPPVGFVEVEDGETGLRAMLDFRTGRASAAFARVARALTAERQAIFSRAKVDEIGLRTDEEYVEPLVRFFQERERRLKWHR